MAKKKTYQEVITSFTNVHGDTYVYSLFTEYTGSKDKIKIICKEHGIFEQSPNHHSQGRGCPQCAIIEAGKKHRKPFEEFVILSNERHNNKFDYSKSEFINGDVKIEIICPEHGSFFQAPRNHLEGYGCSQCAKTGFNPEKPAILYYLKVENKGQTAYKVGITNRTVKERFEADMKYITILHAEEFENGIEAYQKEQKIIKDNKEYRWNNIPLLKNGNSELFNRNILGV